MTLLRHACAAGVVVLPDNSYQPIVLQHLDRALRHTDEDELAALALVLILERELLDALELLGVHGCDTRVLKGPAVARLDYPDPALRTYGDIDVLVPASMFDHAVSVLTAAGCRRRHPQPRGGFDRRFGKAATLVTPRGYELDLHRTLVDGPFGPSIVLDDLWDRPAPFELGGRRLFALGTEARLLHACLHAVIGRPLRPTTVRDIVVLASRQDLDVPRFGRIARRWRVEAPVARALRLASERLAVRLPPAVEAWARGCVPGRRQRWALAASVGDRAGYPVRAGTTVLTIRGARDKAAFVRALAFPDPTYRRPRHRTRRARWRSAAAELSGAARGVWAGSSAP